MILRIVHRKVIRITTLVPNQAVVPVDLITAKTIARANAIRNHPNVIACPLIYHTLSLI